MSILILGDSFVGPFTLLNSKNLEIYLIKGKSMKGLTKENDIHRNKIKNLVNKYQNKNLECIIFNFGNVDLHLSYYYKKFIKNEIFFIEPMIKKYVEFIHSLDCNNCNKIILSAYPTTLKDKNVFDSLLHYQVLSKNDIDSISKIDKEKTSNFNFRYNMYKNFNNLLKKYCKIYNITYINLDNELLNKNKKIKQKFVDQISNVNFHLLWEPLLPILLNKIKCNIPKKYKINLQKSKNKYLIEKKRSFES